MELFTELLLTDIVTHSNNVTKNKEVIYLFAVGAYFALRCEISIWLALQLWRAPAARLFQAARLCSSPSLSVVRSTFFLLGLSSGVRWDSGGADGFMIIDLGFYAQYGWVCIIW
ncbi:hypothetical protein BDW69DRAFT_163936 [Aspergillus filifer]